ncbi:hypothetical protein [Mycobacterium sp. NPDC050853]|uniref:hypothetical protein n=1 Tax=Mycobacterium sp. NPDC050853 TaxID=3155160 RepID=UPI0033FCD14A
MWDSIADPDTWWIHPLGFALVVGNRFTLRRQIVLGTGSIGRYDCAVVAVDPCGRFTFRLQRPGDIVDRKERILP